MVNKVTIAIILLVCIVIVYVIVRPPKSNSAKTYRKQERKAVTVPNKNKEIVFGRVLDEHGKMRDITSSDPYIAPKVFEVGLMHSDCYTADSCRSKLVSSPGSLQGKNALCNPGALYPINGLDPGYGSGPKNCPCTEFVRSP